MGAWGAVGGTASKLSVTAGAKQAGAYGLQAAISGGTSGYVIDNTPSNESSYRARFYFHPNNVTISSTAQDIFVGVNASSQVVFRVQLRRSSGSYQIGATVTRSGGSTSTSWYTISNAVPRNRDQLAVGLKCVLQPVHRRHTQKDAHQAEYQHVQSRDRVLGPSAGISSVQGTEYFDSFVARRSTYIGP